MPSHLGKAQNSVEQPVTVDGQITTPVEATIATAPVPIDADIGVPQDRAEQPAPAQFLQPPQLQQREPAPGHLLQSTQLPQRQDFFYPGT